MFVPESTRQAVILLTGLAPEGRGGQRKSI